jgi:hypothetical protein
MPPVPSAGTLAVMNPHSHQQAHWRARVAVVISATAGLVLLAAGCGSDSGGSPNAGGTGSSSKLVAYSQCMRSHGIPNFPDPASSGGIPKQGAVSAQRAVSNAQAQAAAKDCQHLVAGLSLGGQPIQTITTQQQQDYLNAVACMHSHGITNFPEPSFSGGQVEFPGLEHLVDLKSPQFTRADHICRKLIPPGLPGSGSGG